MKTKGENEESLPEPYGTKLEWRKAKEIQRLPCGFQSVGDTARTDDTDRRFRPYFLSSLEMYWLS
jgi:hypothetical protein